MLGKLLRHRHIIKSLRVIRTDFERLQNLSDPLLRRDIECQYEPLQRKCFVILPIDFQRLVTSEKCLPILPFAPEVRLDIFWIVVLGTALSFTCYNAGLRFLPASQASVTATIEPAISVIASYFIFHTHFNFVQGFGILLVLLAIAVPGIFENEKTAGE